MKNCTLACNELHKFIAGTNHFRPISQRGGGGGGGGDSALGDFEPVQLFLIFKKTEIRKFIWEQFDVIGYCSLTLTFPWQPVFDRSCFQKMENPFLEQRKLTFLSAAVIFLAHISVPLLVLITFRSSSELS